MAGQLAAAGYTRTITLDWTATAGVAQVGQAVAAGEQLESLVGAMVASMDLEEGDVVDLHFVGHSRGAVVVSHAMSEVANWADPAVKGGYARLSLLDPHPANPATSRSLASVPSDANAVDLAFFNAYLAFEREAQDPTLSIPKNVGEVDLLYQRTPASDLDWPIGYPALNVWGTTRVVNLAGAKVKRINLTGLANHSGVHAMFLPLIPSLWL